LEALIQIPIVDLRAVLNDRGDRLTRPSWPFGRVDPDRGRSEFMRGFSSLRNSNPNSTGDWEGRVQYVDAANAVRLPKDLSVWFRASLHSIKPGRPWYSQIVCRERRYFGSVSTPRAFLQLRFSLSGTHLEVLGDGLDVLAALRSMPIRLGSQTAEVALERIGFQLSKSVGDLTTRVERANAVPSWAISAARPLFVLTAFSDELANPAAQSVGQLQTGSSRLSYLFLENADHWIVINPRGSRAGASFDLHLSRIHSERSTFVALASHIARGRPLRDRTDLDLERLEQVISTTSRYLEKKYSFGRDQQQLIEAVESDLELHSAEWEALFRAFRSMRRTTRARAERVVKLINKVEGDYIAGDKMTGIVNSTIINRSAVISSLNKLHLEQDQSIARAARGILSAISHVDSHRVTETAEALIEEIAGRRRSSVVAALWDQLGLLTPSVRGNAEICAVINTLTNVD
jgi:hypothetical protein